MGTKVAEKKKTSEDRVFKSIFHQIMHDKALLNECIRTGGDIKKVASENGIILAYPV